MAAASNGDVSGDGPVLWKSYLYQLQQQAPTPKLIECIYDLGKKPEQYGREFHGRISREEAERLVAASEGAYLVRESQRAPGSFTLTMWFNAEAKHYKLFNDGRHFIAEKHFDSVYDLVADGLIVMYVESHAGDYIDKMAQESLYEESPYMTLHLHQKKLKERQKARRRRRRRHEHSNRLSDELHPAVPGASPGTMSTPMDSRGEVEECSHTNQSVDGVVVVPVKVPPQVPPRSGTRHSPSQSKCNSADRAVPSNSSNSLPKASPKLHTSPPPTQPRAMSHDASPHTTQPRATSHDASPHTTQPRATSHDASPHTTQPRATSHDASPHTTNPEERNIKHEALPTTDSTMPVGLTCADDDLLSDDADVSCEDIALYEKAHLFKVATFRGMNWCFLCGNFMWGLVQQGVRCVDCGFTAHRKCSEQVPPDCLPDLKFVKRVFGVDLTTLVKAHNCLIPIVVEKCVAEIEARGLAEEGIYRVPGFSDDIDYVKALFDRDADRVNLSRKKFEDINTICGVLKQYLRLLPIPVVPYDLYEDFINGAKLGGESQQVESLRQSVRRLPPAHYQLLKYLLCHLVKVDEHRDENKMGVDNISLVFGPTLLCSPDPDPMARLVSNRYEGTVIEILLRNLQKVFTK